MARILVTLFFVSITALACRKSPGPPSPEWERAHALELTLLSRYADEAYGHPEMDEVLALLERVSPDSVDAPEAAALKTRILEERKRLTAREEERQRMLAAAGPGSFSPSASTGESTLPTASPPAPLAPGLTLDAFREAYGKCVEERPPIRIEGPDGGVFAEKAAAFALKADPACKEGHRELADNLAVFVDGKLLAVRPASEVKTVEKKVKAEIGLDGGMVPVRGPDGGYIPVKDGE